ncbi:unnamed protein product [Zymoseptoria tritici ST99CH_1A5]|uniref:C6 transcription factor n=3 Tax=Zymoseptoria tritici TaxID=1047171 RepID=F9XCL8_ZYMTI|nr:C6 transcription factor [Zymoseptoria tritici IPO323]EGP87199.1 C6 transcription factor [Zymoseptoria tritici IPO323]SMQ50916.1 unnamed protein product [Zymoseptoria tritici ST99CH_3D7]SMR54203.1 unnamed protein product [Zymoseptoria tritici ST99CH_3D1]SMY24578.1 unnamed protein product [Zymoseptoria tritici ST99CH_1A5]
MAATTGDHTTPDEDKSGQQKDGRLATVGKKRTRTGCLNCRRKRRKCDEFKPQCTGCKARHEVCEWGVRLNFRPDNMQTMGPEHPSMRQAASSCSKAQNFKIIDVTSEVIRDYFEETAIDEIQESLRPPSANTSKSPPNVSLPLGSTPNNLDLEHMGSIASQIRSPPSLDIHPDLISDTPLLPDASVFFLSPQYSDPAFEDGIFLPGSQYQELHATLRSRIIDTARSTVPSRMHSPEPHPVHVEVDFDDEESRRLAHLSPEYEYELWQNYIEEVASWLDKFDINRHFELVLPIMAKQHPHLRYSILALSARQMERKARTMDNSCSLALYQHAIHLLSPLLQQRTTEVLASCVVLCVLEMMSCSPKAWRRHLDGCAALIQALGISGACGGLEQALFWCFARMDVCGGFISSEKTLIPMHKWIGGMDINEDVSIMLDLHGSFDMYANHAVYLCGQVVDMLCSSGKWEQRHSQHLTPSMDGTEYINNWSRLFEHLDRWYNNRSEEMKPLLTIPSPIGDETKPFHTLLYGNGPATSGNQMYHTGALLMLKFKPSHVQFARKPPSLLWHARQICAISVSNRHHGCWTNSVQPLWIAGQHMSHPSEHRAILEHYERIEREIGWATEWRAADLKEYWGEDD